MTCAVRPELSSDQIEACTGGAVWISASYIIAKEGAKAIKFYSDLADNLSEGKKILVLPLCLLDIVQAPLNKTDLVEDQHSGSNGGGFSAIAKISLLG